jgi:ERCC4-type nuclease
VIADVHERISGIPEHLERLGAQVEVERLPAGDYRVGGGRLVERKTVRDLHLSVIKGRFFRQVGDLRTSCTHPYLLVEGPDITRGPLRTTAVLGTILAVAELGVVVLRSLDPPDSAAWLSALANRARRREARSRPVYAQRPAVRPDHVPEAILAAIPTVSTTSARALLRHFGSVKNVLGASAGELQEVPGIGPVRAAELADAFTRSPGAYRSRRSRE